MAGILFDARWIRPGMTGVGNFAYNLLRALPDIGENIGIILPAGSPYSREFERFHIFFSSIDLTAHPKTEFYEQFVIPQLCYRHGFKSFVSFEGRIPIFHPGIKTFSFVYDLTFLTIRGSHSAKYSFFLKTSLILTRMFSNRIVTISNKVRRDMITLLKIPREKISVICPADSQLTRYKPFPVAALGKSFFLAVGMTNHRKNLANLLEAFSAFNRQYPSYQLALTGNAEWIAELRQKTQVSDVVNLGFVNESELRFLYEKARALIYPSLDEGFGIPLLDALQFDCPVICSDIPIFREVMENCAIYFDPASIKSISEGLEQSLTAPHAPHCRERILEKYSWNKSAKELINEVRRVSSLEPV